MLILLVIHPILRRVYESLYPIIQSFSLSATASRAGGHVSAQSLASTGNARLEQRASFDLYFGIVYLLVLNGSSAFKVFLIFYINYGIATQTPNQHVPAVTWIFNIGILFANELCRGYPYSQIAGLFPPWSTPESNWGSILDRYGGVLPRWEILFNITILRLISFNLDYCWSLRRFSMGDNVSSPIEVYSCFQIIHSPCDNG